ncbi:MAG: mechanosensitive ion channel family protein [Fibrobacterota bacterium]
MNTLFSEDFLSTYLEKFGTWASNHLPLILFIIVFALVLNKVIASLIIRLKPTLLKNMASDESRDMDEEEKRLDTLMSIIQTVARLTILVIATILVLKEIGIDIAPIIAGAGIIGIAVGFGSQNLVRDFFSGFFILLENHIRKGDVGVINGTGGLVEKVGLRTIVLRDFSGVVHVFQNGKIDTLANMTKEWSAAVVTIGVAYKEKIDHVISVIEDVSMKLHGDPEFGKLMLEPAEILGVDELNNSSVDIKIRLKTKPIQQWAVAREFRKRVKDRFDEENIEIPFPHQTIYWGEEIAPLQVNQGTEAE